MNVSRHGLDVVSYENEIYALGGWNGPSVLEFFNGTQWTEITSLPIGQEALAAAEHNGYIYSFGGYGGNDVTQIYNIESGVWSLGSVIPQGLQWATAETIGDSIYLIGGYGQNGSLYTTYIYNILDDMWINGPNLPYKIQTPASTVLNGEIHVFGFGTMGGNARNVHTKLDRLTNTWIMLTPPPYVLRQSEAVTYKQLILLVGGIKQIGTDVKATSTVFIYNQLNNEWTVGNPFIIPRYDHGAIVMDDYLYIIGGRDSCLQSLSSVEISNLSSNLSVPMTPQSPPATALLYQNYPNPFNPITTIQYDLPQRSDVQITIFDLLGKEVTTLVSGTQDAGSKTAQWNAINVPCGMYFYQIKAGEFVQTRKMVLLK